MEQTDRIRINDFILFSYLGGLAILINTPSSWGFWLSGGSNWFLGILVFLSIFWVGGLGFYFGRIGWITPWLWRGWVLILLSTPVFVTILDSAPGYIIRYIAWAWLVAFLAFVMVKEATRKLVKAVSIVVIALLPFFIIMFLNLNKVEGVGPCHLFSELRNRGCIRTVNMVSGGAIFYSHPELGDGEVQIIRSYGSAVFIEPLNRWQALINVKVIQLDERVDYLSLNSDGTQLHTISMQFLPESGFRLVPSAESLVELPSGEIAEKFRLDSYDSEVVGSYLSNLATERTKATDPSELQIAAYSKNGKFLSTINQDGMIDVWQNVDGLDTPLDIIIDPINTERPSYFLPNGEPYWSFVPDVKYKCTSFSADGSLMAGFGEGVLDIYDVVQRKQNYSIPIQTKECPTFSAENQYLTLVNSIGRNELTILAVDSGEILTKVVLDVFLITSIDFSFDDKYLIVSNNNVGPLWNDGLGLVFEVEKLIDEK